MLNARTLLQRDVTGAGVNGRIDFSTQKLKIEVIEQEETQWVNSNPQSKMVAKPLLRTMPQLNSNWGMLSAAALSLKSKLFDDGLYAAVELLVDAGSPTFMGKTEFIRELNAQALLQTQDESYAGLSLLSALELIRYDETQARGNIHANAVKMGREFLNNTERSKPLGFYSWSNTLSRIFKRDRLSQETLPDTQWLPIIKVLKENKALNHAFLRHLLVPSRMTNPLTSAGMALAVSSPEWQSGRVSLNLFPPSTSLENHVMSMLTDADTGPVIDEIIKHLRSGRVKIVPGQNSGWYDHQLYALSALVLFDQLPEAKKLVPDEQYRQCLDELFKGFYALTREIHIKQLETRYGAGIPIPKPKLYIIPGLTAEPLPTYYYRKSQAYQFINQVLQEIFGSTALKEMRRLTADGPVEQSLLDELTSIEMLFRGAAASSCIELGMEPGLIIEGDYQVAYDHFTAYRQQSHDDQELLADCRMMVPVMVNAPDDYLVWAFLGWEDVQINVSYLERPKVLSTTIDTNSQDYKNFKRMHGDREPEPEIEYRSARYSIYRPVCAELRVKQLLNRDEFRALCNQYRSAQEITAQLTVHR
jgi:hypothetical protein